MAHLICLHSCRLPYCLQAAHCTAMQLPARVHTWIKCMSLKEHPVLVHKELKLRRDACMASK